MEIWGCCQTYKKRADDTLALSPNTYRFKSRHVLDPKKDAELIFYFTCIVDIARIGFTIDRPEEDAKKLNEQEYAELEVRYAIAKQLDETQLKYTAKAWGISTDNIGTEQLRRILFDEVKKSEQQREVTKKGYAEFMDEVMNKNEALTEARAVINMALDKSIVSVHKTTRKATYVPSGDTMCIVPLSDSQRVADYLADFILRDKNKDLYDTIKQDVSHEKPKVEISIADVEGMKTKDELLVAAKKLSIPVSPNSKEETLRIKIVEKLQNN
jgi:hypothetical protein